MNQAWCSALSGGVRPALQIQPGAKRSEVTGCVGELLKIRLHAEPVDGKANDALIAYLAALRYPKAQSRSHVVTQANGKSSKSRQGI
jgi:uncharacterized protein YggU (UPF0235/DUF167 family)